MPDTARSPRLTARSLYWQGWRLSRIAEELSTPVQTVHSWKVRDEWDKSDPVQRVGDTLEARLVQLIHKDAKEGRDFKEIDLLGRQIERLARVRQYQSTGKESDLNPRIHNRNQAPRRKPKRNDISEEGAQKLRQAFERGLFDYQRQWREAFEKHRIRNILKSRQVGATYYFAREAGVDAAETGKNKIFLSASKAQAYIFRNYITQFVQQELDIELRGDPIVLSNGAELHFLGTNSKTAQGYHGDVYLDEYFWIQRFLEFRKVTSGMAMHKKWRQTYFSTPSSVAHEAYPFWSGALFNEGRAKKDQVEIDTSRKALRNGALCADGQWRQIVTVEDAVAGGCDLFDLEQLRLEYSEEEFRNLLMCEFMDDSTSAFPMQLLQSCMVDSWEQWDDFRPFAPRPVGDAPVWVGYDPAGDGDGGDGAGLSVVLPPQGGRGRHRVIERKRLHGQDYEAQAQAVLDMRKRYNVEHIGIDITGIGDAVARIVARSWPTVTRIQYSPVVKAQMVMQAQQIMRKGRLEFDAGWSDLAQAFMAIRREMTAGGRAVTYTAGRTARTGHADLAWATMHALSHEPIEQPATGGGGSVMEMSG